MDKPKKSPQQIVAEEAALQAFRDNRVLAYRKLQAMEDIACEKGMEGLDWKQRNKLWAWRNGFKRWRELDNIPGFEWSFMAKEFQPDAIAITEFELDNLTEWERDTILWRYKMARELIIREHITEVDTTQDWRDWETIGRVLKRMEKESGSKHSKKKEQSAGRGIREHSSHGEGTDGSPLQRGTGESGERSGRTRGKRPGANRPTIWLPYSAANGDSESGGVVQPAGGDTDS